MQSDEWPIPSDCKNGDSVKDERKDDGRVGAPDDEGGDFDDGDKLTIVMALRWDYVSRYQWQMTMTDGNNEFGPA